MQVNIGELLSHRARRDPKVEALVDTSSGERFTYAEINARTNQTAHMLRGLGVRPGDRVAVLLMNGTACFESFFACAKIGAVAVPLNWRLVADELAYILADSGAKTLIFDSDFAEHAAILHAGGQTAVDNWLQVAVKGAQETFARNYGAGRDGASADEPPLQGFDDDNLFIMYTSGTTGRPKGVVHTHLSTFWVHLNVMSTQGFRVTDRYLTALPLFHIGGLAPFLAMVHSGVTNVLMRSFDPAGIWKLIAEEKITTTLAVPAMLNAMLQMPAPDPKGYAQLRSIISGASPVPVVLMEHYRDIGIEIHQVYGLTESGGPGCLISPQDAMERLGSTGKPFLHMQLRLIDGNGQDVPPNTPGEVLLYGSNMMKEYWNNPQATRETLRDGWLHTGDVAVMDADGFVTIQDRIKDMIISGGENVYPAEIENVVLGHPDIKECAVIAMPSERWGESPLVVAVRTNDSVDDAAILAHCDGKLARFKQPKGVVFIDAIPRNPSGKALKFELRERFPGPAPE